MLGAWRPRKPPPTPTRQNIQGQYYAYQDYIESGGASTYSYYAYYDGYYGSVYSYYTAEGY
jgi:hypothetical protein